METSTGNMLCRTMVTCSGTEGGFQGVTILPDQAIKLKEVHMASSDQKTVLIGISGCIAAYKACEVVRGLQNSGLRVKVVMTEHATHFVDPLTFRSLTHEPVAVGLFDDP